MAECEKGSAKAKGPSKYGKGDLRYWKDAIFCPTYRKNGELVHCRDYSVRIKHKGNRGVFSLGTQNEGKRMGNRIFRVTS